MSVNARDDQGRWWRAWARLIVSMVATAGLLVGVAPAFADSATISVTNTANQPDPAAGVPRVFTLSGTASVPERVYVKVRAPGGAPCAPNADSDSGTIVHYQSSEIWYGDSENGAFSIPYVLSWDGPGPEVFCIWLSRGYSTTITPPITQTITFRAPNGTITAAVSPSVPTPGQQATVTATGSSEAPERVFAKIRATGGAPCAPTYDSDTGANLIDGQSVNGSFSVQATATEETAGTYLICLWLAGSSTDTSPAAGPQPETFTVAAPPAPRPPPAPCVVPVFSHKARLGPMEQRIRAAHCSVGHVGYIRSRRVRKGYVIALSPRTGTRLGSGARVDIVVSTGRPKAPKRRH